MNNKTRVFLIIYRRNLKISFPLYVYFYITINKIGNEINNQFLVLLGRAVMEHPIATSSATRCPVHKLTTK